MQVKVHYISLVKSYTNKSQDEFNLPESTPLSELLDKIAANLRQTNSQQEVYDPAKKEMKPTFVAMVNGVLMDQLKGVEHTPQRRRQHYFDVANDRRLNTSKLAQLKAIIKQYFCKRKVT